MPAHPPQWPDRWRALALLAGLVVLLALGLAAPPGAAGGAAATGAGDVALYRGIAAEVAAGAGYYPAAVGAQLANGYPTTPSLVVRLPTLTYLQVWLGPTGATVLLAGLGMVAVLAMLAALDRAGLGLAERVAGAVLLAANVAVCAIGPVSWFAEAWAGMLVLAAIAVRTERSWWLSVLLGLAAVCFRELALPFLLVMAVLSWRRRREPLAWCAAIAVFAVGYGLHTAAVAAAQPATPVTSPGWLQFGGWAFVVAATRMGSVLAVLPQPVAAVAVPLGLFGWAQAGGVADRALATCLAFVGLFLVFGRPDNTYWGLLFGALLLTGLAFVPRGVAQLHAALRGRHRYSVG